jgi:hypothetical protein
MNAKSLPHIYFTSVFIRSRYRLSMGPVDMIIRGSKGIQKELKNDRYSIIDIQVIKK